MARYSDEQVERVKQEVSLLRLVEAKGIVLKPHGKDYIGHCPFHDDKTPSFVVSPHNNLWNCLGACGVGGSVVDWVMKLLVLVLSAWMPRRATPDGSMVEMDVLPLMPPRPKAE